MAFRIPVELREAALTFKVKKWIESRNFPQAHYFETIDIVVEQLEKLNSDGDVTNKQLATILAVTIDHEGSLAEHALKAGVEIGTDEKWSQICTAAAWTVLQSYFAAREKGEWPS
ncbi:hypothetical protein [Modestobacter sp. URMC 112]